MEKPEQLLLCISIGDEGAFGQLFNLYYQRLFHVALYFLKSKEWAEEAVSDVFFLLWKQRERLPEINDLTSYLYISVKNQSLHYLRRSPDTGQSDELYTIELVADSDNPESLLLDQEYQALVQEAINALPEKCREVFRLVLSDKLTQKQISQLLGISIKTVEAHVANAYKKISSHVQRKYSNKKRPNLRTLKILFL